MAAPSPGYSITLQVETPVSFTATTDLAAAVAGTGAAVTALDVVESHHSSMVVAVSCDTVDVGHAETVRTAVEALEGVTVHEITDRTFQLHEGGKIETTLRVPLRTRNDLSRAYTPGVARVCKAIAGTSARRPPCR